MAVEDTSVIALNRQQINTAGFSKVSAEIVIYIDAHYMEPVSSIPSRKVSDTTAAIYAPSLKRTLG